MHARSALFDVYGDHLRSRGDQAPVAALVRLLDAGRASPPRRAHGRSRGWSRRAGWSRSSCAAGRGYRATERAIERLDRGRRPDLPARATRAWDGRWRLVFVDAAPRPRRARTRLRAELALPRATPSTRRASGSARSTGPRSTRCVDRAGGTRPAPRVAVELRPRPGRRRGTWPRSPTSYAAWPRRRGRASSRGELGRHDDEDEAAFAARFHLVHEWRKFLFADPGLPAALLPARLAGPGGRGPVRQRGGPAQAGRRPVRGPLPGRADRRGRPTACRHDRRRLARPARRRRRRRDHHAQPARRDEQPRRRDQGGAARRRAPGGRRPGRALRGADRHRPRVLRRAGPQGAHRDPAERRRRDALFRTVDEHYNPIVTALAGDGRSR